jgi:ABC-type antimicrobial peptide transport system permease subunit
VYNRATANGQIWCGNTTPKVLARTIEKDIPEVEMAVRVPGARNFLFTVGDKRLTAQGLEVDSNFLQMFSFPLIHGNLKTVLNDMYSIVLTEKLARRLFGPEEALGKVIQLDNKDNFTVTGVLKDLPNNTAFNFDYLLPWSYLHKTGGDDDYWGNNSTETFVLLKANASLATADAKMKLLKQHYDADAKRDNWQLFLYPISRWHLYANFDNGVENKSGKISFVRLFGIIAAFILLIACINFMNLSTARSEKRAKEVGIRKVVGALKSSLIGQFIGESILLSAIAGFIAVVVVQLSLPGFNLLVGKTLFIRYGSVYFWLAALGFVFFTGLLAGSYPAFFLSSFQPVKVLKESFKKPHALITPRKILVVLQFSFAVTLIICTIVVKQQVEYAKSRETGYDRENVIYHPLSGDIGKNYTLIRSDLLSSGAVVSVTKTSGPLTDSWSNWWGQQWEGRDPNDRTDVRRFNEDGDLGKTAGLQFVLGRDIDPRQYPSDSMAMVINESAWKLMKFRNPIGQIIRDHDDRWHIVGVIKDFILESPYQPISPMLIYGPNSWFNFVHIRLNSAHTTANNLKTVEAIFKKYNPQYPFEYQFTDEAYARKFEDEKRSETLSGLFAGLTILISCLGLFGLATYMAEARVKEIGVRKVLGASVASITGLLSRDFVKLVIIAILIASPIAWFGMYEWLQNYQYRVPIHWAVFAAAGLMAIVVAMVAVSYQSVKAALANPTKSLRSE